MISKFVDPKRTTTHHRTKPDRVTCSTLVRSAISNDDHVRAKPACALDGGSTGPPAADWTAGHRLTSANWKTTDHQDLHTAINKNHRKIQPFRYRHYCARCLRTIQY
jgi:hypothetical protein